MAMEMAPEDQDKLAQLFGGRLGGNQADAMAGAAQSVTPGNMGAPPIATITPGSGRPGAGALPRSALPSDDPVATGVPRVQPAPPVPTVPTFQSPDVAAMADLNRRIATASAPINRADYKPSIWQKILAPLAGALGAAGGGGGGEQAIGITQSILNSKYNRALDEQQRTVAPLQAEFERERQMAPMRTQANENAQRTFQDQNSLYDQWQRSQDRQDATEQRRDAASERTNIRQQEESRRSQEDESTPAPGARPEFVKDADGKISARIKTKAGGYMPYSPKSIDEGAMAGDPTATRLFNRAHPGKEDKGEKEGSKTQFRLIESRKQDALDAAEDKYSKRIQELDDLRSQMSRGGKKAPDDSADRQAAAEQLSKDKQRAQRAYEAEITAAGGTVTGSGNWGGKPQPDGGGSQQAKAVTRDVVQKYADSHKVGNRQMTYDEALKGFQSKGYDVKQESK